MNGTRRELQMELEQLYDKNQLMKRIRSAFRECEVKFTEFFKKNDIPEDAGFDLLANMAVHKRATVPTLVGNLRHHFGSAQEAATMIEKAVNARFVEYSTRDQQLIVRFGISQDLQCELDRFQFPLPMIVSPKPIESNLDSGYLTAKASVILRDNHHDDDVCLDHLNRMNQVKLSINMDVANHVQNKWKKLAKKKSNETWEEYQKRLKTFEKYNSVTKDVLNLLTKEGNELYLTHRYDKRGRTYCMGFHVTYQGTDWNKAVIEFADKEVLTD